MLCAMWMYAQLTRKRFSSVTNGGARRLCGGSHVDSSSWQFGNSLRRPPPDLYICSTFYPLAIQTMLSYVCT